MNNVDYLEIKTLKIKEVTYIEIMHNDLFYIKSNKLHMIKNYNDCKDDELERQSVCLPYENVFSLLKIKDALFLTLGKDGQHFLGSLQNDGFKILTSVNTPYLEEYLELSKTKALALFNDVDNTNSAIYSIDLKGEVSKLNHQAHTKIYSIARVKNTIYANVKAKKGSEVYVIAKLDYLSRLKPENIFFSKGVFYKLVSKKDRVLMTADSFTQLVDKNSKSIFEDREIGKSGMQINSSLVIQTRLGRSYTFLSSWRRSKEHPLSCLYILRNETKRLYKKTDDITSFEEGLKWTGFHIHKTGFVKDYEQSFAFCNKFGYPLVLTIHNTLLKKNQNLSKILPCKEIPYADDKSVILENKIQISSKDTKNVSVSNLADLSPNKRTKYYITIDVEQHLKNIPFAITGEGLNPQCGVYLIMDILEKYSLKGVFFINIYEHKNFNDVIEKIIKDIDDRGHEVALHHHSNPSSKWTNNIIDYDLKEQIASLRYGKEFIEHITKKPCVSFRGGAYLINADTLKALQELGFKYESSAFALSKQDMVYKSINKLARYGSLVEFPVTTNFLPNYLSKIDINTQGNAKDMLDMMITHRKHGLTHIVTMLHSFSFIRWQKGGDDTLKSKLRFTANRYAVGVNNKLIKEFDDFCRFMSLHDEFENSTFEELKDEDIVYAIEHDRDILPKDKFIFNTHDFCPICKKEVRFASYRSRKKALCPNCRSLERMRLKYLYLERIYKIYEQNTKNILHIGPAMCVYNELKKISWHNYLTSDPFSDAIYKYPLEKMPFEKGFFNLIICVGILMHVLDDDKCLLEMIRLLSSDGKMILWLGGLSEEKTEERYDRSDFDKMIATDFSYPQDLSKGQTIELPDGKIGYNPRFSTRTYGKDVLTKLEKFGLDYELFYAKDLVGFQRYGIREDDLLIIANKRV
ncbi:hypothetical protein DMB92_08930 [Campylobacter sp. MIT 99-7217]|uniref:polysaccharide deacetylase family protein n=1 Tax=Campylobacter sp. MIT 99-7217 TaxID=535091 RepID=UPI00115A64E9|nr:polysaccharide deacetylase family protein [Campylobacter sp. MIT 99-7217]TQR28851.1 hypothetical protein DMB92_08930 [Campylobacter sp. MIT 99-7217]